MQHASLALAARISTRSERDLDTGCVLWIGATKGGYGVIVIDGRQRAAHRVAYELARGPIAEGLVVDHLCENKLCVNPEHLDLVTPGENVRRWYAGERFREVVMDIPRARGRMKRKLPKILTRDEAAALMKAPNLRAPTGLRNRCMLELMYRAGLRVGEVVALMPRDVDIANGTVRIFDGKGGDGTAYFDPDVVGPLLDRWRDVRRGLGARKVDPFFCTLQGGSVSTRYVQQMTGRMRRRAGITAVCTPHVLRHTFATELLDEGFSIREVQEALRHAQVQTTQIYTWVVDTQLRAKIQARRRSQT